MEERPMTGDAYVVTRQQKKRGQWTENAGVANSGLAGQTHFVGLEHRTWDRFDQVAFHREPLGLHQVFLEMSLGASSSVLGVPD